MLVGLRGLARLSVASAARLQRTKTRGPSVPRMSAAADANGNKRKARPPSVCGRDLAATWRALPDVAVCSQLPPLVTLAPPDAHRPSAQMVRIGTHDGTFHADEALGCWLLRRTQARSGAPLRACVLCSPRLTARVQAFKDAEVVRTRDQAVLSALDVIIDVGAVYDPGLHATRDPSRHGGCLLLTCAFPSSDPPLRPSPAWLRARLWSRCVHSATLCAKTRCWRSAMLTRVDAARATGHTTKLSSAGLVYKHFGREIVAAEMGVPAADPSVETVYLKLYKSFMEALDGIDNGVAQYECAPGTKPRYESHTHLSARVGNLNPAWNEEVPASGAGSVEARFHAAMELTGSEFQAAVAHVARGWLPARQHVVEALASARNVHPSGAILRLPQFCPWKVCKQQHAMRSSKFGLPRVRLPTRAGPPV